VILPIHFVPESRSTFCARDTEIAIESIRPENDVDPSDLMDQELVRRALISVSGTPRLFIQFIRVLMRAVKPGQALSRETIDQALLQVRENMV